jgi:hypothetical protein
MICALTVRRLRPGTFESFRPAFMEHVGTLPPTWVRFTMARAVDDPDQVVTFGLFDGTVDELRASVAGMYDAQQAAIAPFVEAKVADGLFEIVEDRGPAGA